MGRLVSNWRARTLAPLLGVSLILVACGGGEGIRITAATSTTQSTATGTPTPTASRTPGEQQTLIAVPTRPENPFASGRDVEAYLRGGEPDLAGCLPELVQAWALAQAVEGPRCVEADLDGDGLEEYAFLVSFGNDAGPAPADLWFFDDEDEDRRFFNSARALANGSASGLQIRERGDFTGDGLTDIVTTWEDCGTSGCVTHLLVASHHNGRLENVAPGDASLESLAEFVIQGATIRMEGGIISDTSAGPQRGAVLMVSWGSSRFRVDHEPGKATHLIHLVNDADVAFAAADYANARTLYDQVISNSDLADWQSELGQAAGNPELKAYASFRAAIAESRQGNMSRLRSLMQRTATEYGSTMHGSIAASYLAALEDGATPEEACGAAEIFIEAFQAQYVDFWDFGSANPQRTVFTLCR